ncbi:MAG: hypothetical protein Q9P44_21715 [Anaerolineae bacterium]|nr:hypothetical protein [Anaerolineae bacterium]
MDKRKHRNMKWNRILQWVIIALIISIVVGKFNLWAFWWIPFLFIGLNRCGCSWKTCSIDQDKRKHYDDDDDIDYV